MLDIIKKRMEMIKNRKEYLQKIENSNKKVLPNSKIYLFGSILEENLVGGSDIDILIVDKLPQDHLKRAKIVTEIEENAGLPLSHPFEIHLISPKEFEKWNSIYQLKYMHLSEYVNK